MTAYLYRMPAGIPGNISRPNVATTVLPIQLSIAAAFASYGIPLAVESGTQRARPITAGDTAASVFGMLVRPFPYTGGTVLGVSAPPSTGGTFDSMTKGFMSVKVNGATVPVKGGLVYVRTAAGTGTIIGGIEAAADGGNTFVMTNAYFTGGVDSTGNSEISYN